MRREIWFSRPFVLILQHLLATRSLRHRFHIKADWDTLQIFLKYRVNCQRQWRASASDGAFRKGAGGLQRR